VVASLACHGASTSPSPPRSRVNAGFLVDGDIVFLQDPIPILAHPRNAHFHIQAQSDGAEHTINSGFMWVPPTPEGVALLGRAWAFALENEGMRQQPAVNRAIKEFVFTNRRPGFRLRVLPLSEFPAGHAYFEYPVRRMFPWENPCQHCVIVHNNWILGLAAKVFRFQEHLLWAVDTAEGYYSSPTNKYLEYGNPDPAATLEEERAGLKTAFKLGQLLDRVVILPAFRCHGCRVKGAKSNHGCAGGEGDVDMCSFLAHWALNAFIGAMGRDSFREHSFRYNPLAHPDVRLTTGLSRLAPTASADGGDGGGVTCPSHMLLGHAGVEALAPPQEPFWFISSRNDSSPPMFSLLNEFGDEPGLETTVHILKPAAAGSPSEDELLMWFGGSSERVLHLHSIRGWDFTFQALEREKAFAANWSSALKCSGVRQIGC
jgi:hypothetical protein